MKKAGKPNALLIELVIVLLFFSLSASVILQLFVATHNRSVRSKVDSGALELVEDLADRFYVSELTEKIFFEAEGWSAKENGYERLMRVEGRMLSFEVTGVETEQTAGTLSDMVLSVTDGEIGVVTLPIARYQPGEVTP